MKDILSLLDSTAGKVITIITLFSILGGGAWSFFNWQASLVREEQLNAQLKDIATKTEVAMQMNDLAIELVTVTIMGYEDELVGLTFLVESGEATPMDRVKQQNIINRLEDLRKKLGRLEDTAAELQRVGTRDIRQTGQQVTE